MCIQPNADELTIKNVGNVTLQVSIEWRASECESNRSIFCGRTCSQFDIVWKIRCKVTCSAHSMYPKRAMEKLWSWTWTHPKVC